MIVQDAKRGWIVSLSILALFPLYFASYHYHLAHSSALALKPPHNSLILDRSTFIREWLDVHVGDPSKGSSLARLCNQSHIRWRPNLVLNLDDANGGIGNVRGNILDFLFFAVEAGASIMLPSFAARSRTDLSSLWNGKIGFETFFDEDYFVNAFANACPQLDIYKQIDGQGLSPALPARYGPPSMRSDMDPAHTPRSAVGHFNSWLVEQQADLSTTVLVNFGRTLWEGPDTRSIPSEIRRDFGGLLRLQPNVRRLAASIVYNLSHRFLIPIDPGRLYYPHAFYGAHLRTEQDAANAGWINDGPHANFSSQTSDYLAKAIDAGLSVIYTASGDASELSRFADKAWSWHRINVTSKHELLFGDDLAALQAMTWDQQALVDYEVLQRCSQFGGYVKSSFSYNIAITRSVMAELEGKSQEPFRTKPTDDTVAFEDSLSTVWGRDGLHESKVPRGAWPKRSDNSFGHRRSR